ncbi:hypothetical protein ACEPAI_6034 [Sanghuangporus weigelae]
MTYWSFSANCDTSQGSRNTAMLSSIPCDTRFLAFVRHAQPGLSDCDTERAFSLPARKLPESTNKSWRRITGWLALSWIPSILAAPFVILSSTSGPVSILLIFSVTMSAPVFAFNSVFSPLPIPTDLFEDLFKQGKGSRLSRAIGYLSRVPKLSDLPFKSATSDERMRQETTKNNPQYDPDATSAFVAINTCCTNELGWLPASEMRDVPRSVQIRRDSHPRSCRSAMLLHLLSAGGPAQV